METPLAFSVNRAELNKINPPGNISANYLKASEFIKLTVDKFNALNGKKLNFIERLSFRITKMRLKHDLKKNADLKITHYVNEKKHKGRFNFLWFILGFAAPVIGLFGGSLIIFALVAISPVVVAYATKQDKVNRKSVWLGFGAGILTLLLIAFILISSNGIGLKDE